MASSFIGFNDNGFWAGDGFVEASQLLLFEEINNQYRDTIEWLNIYKKEIALQSLPLMVGAMSMCLDETLIDQSRKEILLELINKIKNRIASDENYLTGKHLNELRRNVIQFLVAEKAFEWDEKEIEKQIKNSVYRDELPKKNYIRGFELLEQLISGQINFKPDTPVTYWQV